MIEFEKELEKFHPSLEFDDAEEALRTQDTDDLADVLIELVNSAEKERALAIEALQKQ